jgi:hypothetical protein
MSQARWIMLSLLAMLLASAISSASASASDDYFADKAVAISPLEIESKGKIGTIESTIAKTPTAIECSEDSIPSSTENVIEEEGKSKGKIELRKCSVFDNVEEKKEVLKTCTVKEPVELRYNGELTSTTEATLTGLSTEENLAELEIKTCSLEGSYKLKGSEHCSISEAQTERTTHEVICTPTGSKVKLGSETAKLYSTEPVKLKADQEWGTGPKPTNQPHWYSEKTRLTESNEAGSLAVESGTGEGLFTMLDTPNRRSSACTMSDTGKIWNPVGGDPGKGVIEGIRYNSCISPGGYCATEPALEAQGLFWNLELDTGRGGAVFAVILPPAHRVEMDLLCNNVGVLYKALFPTILKIANGTGLGATDCVKPTHTTYMEFEPLLNILDGPANAMATLSGKDCIWGTTREELIEVQAP